MSLVFLCAQKVVSDHASLRRALDFIPKELYPVLFKAAFLGKKTLVLQDLVQRWPFPILSFQKLLQCNRHCDPGQFCEKPSRLSIQTVILGVMAYLGNMLNRENEVNPVRKQRLRLLDMTGAHDDGLEQGPDTMSLWARTVSLAKACIDISKRHYDETTQASKRRRGHNDTAPPPPASGDVTHVEVRVDLFVNSTSYSVLREALLVSSHGPLRLQCRDLRAEELSLRSTVELLELLRPAGVRQVDLRFNNLGLEGLNALLPFMIKFTSLQSVKLPYSNIDVRRLSPHMEEAMKKFSSLIGQLTSLKELNLGSSRLSGRLLQLLGGLQQPMESLELAFCYLLPADFYYLSQSIHVSSLKKLDLSGNNLSEQLFPPFQQLLSTVSSSLLHLDIMECKLSDSTLSNFTPTLCRCSRLRYLGLFCNPLSSRGLKALLQSCLGLQDLKLVVYPYPVDCYSDDLAWPGSYASLLDSSFDQEKLAHISSDLGEMLVRAQRTDVVWTTDMCLHRSLDYLNL